MRRVKIFRKLNNGGAGVVAVIVAIALVSILVSVVLSTSYANFKIKQTNYQTKDNFYSAEQALDEINIGLQGFVSEALSYAYLEVLSEYNDGDADSKNELMESLYYEKLWDYLSLSSDSTYSYFDISILQGFVSMPWNDDKGVLVSSKESKMFTYEKKGIVLKDVQVYYKDAKGYSTIITTDIRLVCPQIQFGSTTEIPDIMNYALVADDGLVINGKTSGQSTNTITGQVYAGYIKAEANNGSKIKLDFLDVDSDEKSFTIVSKGNMNFANAEVSFPETGVMWTNSVVLNSSVATFRGTSNLSNDLMLNGKNSKAIIKDRFNAYGNGFGESETHTGVGDPDKSSSIIINGTGSELDLTDSEIIAIAGHAFVGTKAAAIAEDTMTVGEKPLTQKKGDVLTGESIAVKSNQLLYLLPGEAVGVLKNVVKDEKTGKEIDVTYGPSKYGKNPLTTEEYKEISNSTKYADVNKDYVFFKVAENGKLVEKKYSYFSGEESQDRVENKDKYEVIKVFIPSGKTTMVYYYIKFKDDKLANEFFQYYYNLNPEKLEKYLSFYTKSIKMPDTTNLVRFQTAGNLLTQTETVSDVGGTNVYSYKSELVKNTVNGSGYFDTSSDLYTKQKKALCTKLITNYMSFTSDELKECETKNIVFEKLVNEEKFKALTNANGGTDVFTISTETGDVSKVIITNKDYVYKKDDSLNTEINLIICSGNVTVEKDFTGLILCNGTITVEPDVNIIKDDAKTKVAFRVQKTEGSEIISPLSIMVDGTNVVDMGGGLGITGQSLSLPDLVVYENWTKE